MESTVTISLKEYDYLREHKRIYDGMQQAAFNSEEVKKCEDALNRVMLNLEKERVKASKAQNELTRLKLKNIFQLIRWKYK